MAANSRSKSAKLRVAERTTYENSINRSWQEKTRYGRFCQKAS
jgi:hypothetical protein